MSNDPRKFKTGIAVTGTATVGGDNITTNNAAQTLQNKTIDADANTITNIDNADIKVGAAIDAAKIHDGSVSNAEFGYLDGVTSPIQTQLDSKVDDSEKGAANGVATLNAAGKLTSSQVPAIAITETFVVANIAARDALTIGSADGEIQEGDVVVVTDASADPAVDSGGASYIYDGAAYQRLLTPDSAVQSVNGQTGVVVLDSDDISEGSTNLYFSAERAQDAVGAALTDTATIDFVYDDTANTITADVKDNSINGSKIRLANTEPLRARNGADDGDIDVLSVFGDGLIIGGGSVSDISMGAVGNIALNTDADIVLTPGSGQVVNVTNHRITNVTNPTNAQDAATKAYVDSAVGSGGSPGDLDETTFALSNNQTTLADVTGFVFANAEVRSFKAQAVVEIDATVDLYEVFDLEGVQKGSDWSLSYSSTGDDSLVAFDITTAGQIRYTSGNYAGFVDGSIKFRALTLSV